MSLDLLTQYIDHALTFERMADAEPNQGLEADFERQAVLIGGTSTPFPGLKPSSSGPACSCY